MKQGDQVVSLYNPGRSTIEQLLINHAILRIPLRLTNIDRINSSMNFIRRHPA